MSINPWKLLPSKEPGSLPGSFDNGAGMATISFRITVAKNTPIRLPMTLIKSSGLPRIVGGEIQIPQGAAGQVGVRVTAKQRPVYPDNGDWVTGDNRILRFTCDWLIPGPYYPVTIEAYNLDNTFPHTIEALIMLEQGR